MVRIALKGIAANKTRLVLTALAVAIGVAVVSVSLIFSDTARKALDDAYEDAFAGTDVVVQSDRDGANGLPEPIDASLLTTIEDVEGVEAAAGTVSLRGVIPLRSDGEPFTRSGAQQLGLSWTADERLNPFTIGEGRAPEAANEVAVDTATAKSAGYEVGQTIEVVADARRSYRMVGLAEFGGGEESFAGATSGGTAPQGTAVLFTLPEIQRLAGIEGRFDSISVAAEQGVGEEDLRDRIVAALPAGIEVTTGQDEQEQQTSEGTSATDDINAAVLSFALLMLVVAAFVIFNTFSITVAQRVRQMALLRAVGASGRQVRAMVLVEALVLGLVASVVGLFAGLGLAVLYLEANPLDLGLPTTGLQLLPRTWIIAIALGTAITLIAAYVPARRAAAVPPVEAMRADFASSPRSAAARARVAAAITVLGVVALGLSFALDSTGAILASLVLGALLVLGGVVGFGPLLVGPLASVVGWPMARLSTVAGKLGRDNAVRNPHRTAATAGALTVGVALVAVVGIATSSLGAQLGSSFEDQNSAAFVVGPELGNEFPFSPEVAAAMRERPLVGQVGQARVGSFTIDGGSMTLTGVNLPDFGELHDPDFVDGEWVDLVPGTVALRESKAEELGLAVGSEVTLTFADGPEVFTVAALYDESFFGDYFITLPDYVEHYAVQQDVVVLANPAKGADAADARREIERALARYPQLQVQTEAEASASADAALRGFRNLLLIPVGIAILIAILGLMSTLALSVFERTREIGLLRAVGLGPRQVQLMVICESVVVAVIGAALGLAVGVLLGVLLIEREPNVTTLSIPWAFLIGFLVVSAAAGVLAALLPARRAARLSVLRAIAQE